MAGSLLEFPTSVSSRSTAGNHSPMRADLVEQAAQVIPDPPVLINMVSKRVKQLAMGRPALVERRPGLREADIALLEIIQGKTTVSEASRQFDLPPSEIESWVDEGKRGLENALRAKPEDVREQYERQLKDLQEAYGEAMLELRARKKLASLLGKDET